MQEKAKASLRESSLLAPSSRGVGASSRNLALDFSCMSVFCTNNHLKINIIRLEFRIMLITQSDVHKEGVNDPFLASK